MYSFYFFGTSNFQDMLPVLFEHLKNNDNCWVCFFDCFSKKRQLYHYEEKEIIDFFTRKCKEFNCSIPKISFFTKDQQEKYKKEYFLLNPTTVYVQEINPKYPIWYPRVTKNCQVIHFAWWDEVKHLNNPLIKPNISILKQQDDLKYGYDAYPNMYAGNIRMDHLKYTSKKKDNIKRCFIPETYLRMSLKEKANSLKIAKFCNDLIDFLHENNYEIIWKKREKGFPQENWCSPLDLIESKPDIIVEKDLRFPSSLCEDAYVSDCCIVINDSFAFFDIMHMNSNCIILTTEGGRKHKIDDFFASDYSENIIDMKLKGGWELLKKQIEKSNNFVYNDKNNVSKKIIEYVKKNEK